MDLSARLSKIIERDKTKNPKYLLEVIRSDFYYLINNYFEVDFNNIGVNIDAINGKYNISIACNGDRLKLMNNLPR